MAAGRDTECPTVSFRSASSPLAIDLRHLGSDFPLCPDGRHRHDHFVLVFAETGCGSHVVRANELQLTQGSVFALAPGDEHDCTDGDAKGWIVAFMLESVDTAVADGSWGGSTFPLPGDPRWAAFVRRSRVPSGDCVVPEGERAAWRRRFVALENELLEQPVGYGEAVRAHLSLLLVDATRVFMATIGDIVAPIDPVVADALDLIDRHYAEQISLEEIAHQVARSPGHVSRVTKRLTGQTVMQCVEERRMREARRLLLRTDLKIEAVADRVGYPDAGYFRRRFRSVHGAPPQAWRQLSR